MASLFPTFSPKGFASVAENIFSASLKGAIKNRIVRLDELTEKLDSSSVPEVRPDMLLVILNKLKKVKTSLGDTLKVFTRRECRLLCHAATQFVENDNDYSKIVAVLKANWQDCFIKGLLRFILFHWNSMEKNVGMRELYNLFINKLQDYSGDNVKIIHWKNIARCFYMSGYGNANTMGPSYFLSNHFRIGQDLLEAPSCLMLPKAFFQAQYFQKVIRMYYMALQDLPKDFEAVLEAHRNSETTKMVLADLICESETVTRLTYKQKSLQALALQMIGHPSKQYAWNLPGYDDVTNARIERARTIVNKWLISAYIDEIFRGFIHDDERRDFWMKYASYITEIKVAGRDSLIPEFKECDALCSTIDECFIEMSHKGRSSCAVLMKMQDIIFVEFSDKSKGSVYIYRDISPVKPIYAKINRLFNEKYIAGSIDDHFKQHKTQKKQNPYPFISRFSILDYGKIRHYSGTNEKWDETLEMWISRKLNIYV